MKIVISTLWGNGEKVTKEVTTLEDFEKLLKASEMICNHVDMTPTVILEKWPTDNEWHLTVVNAELF